MKLHSDMFMAASVQWHCSVPYLLVLACTFEPCPMTMVKTEVLWSFVAFWPCTNTPEWNTLWKKGSRAMTFENISPYVAVWTGKNLRTGNGRNAPWSFRLSSALQSLHHVLSGNEKKITVFSQFVLFLWRWCNLSETSAPKAISRLVWAG